MTDHIRDAAMRTCDRQALARSYHMAEQEPAWVRFLEVCFRPHTILSMSILGLMVWALCGFPGIV